MAGKPIATIGSMHICPKVETPPAPAPPIPHVGGPVLGPGVTTVLINDKPAAVKGDKCVCVGPPDSIKEGNANVLFNGKQVATMGSKTAHGGFISIGDPTVLIG
ncbi:PAAR domain-containing protein [Xanthovirga aplysinae]|uniref:PAAR domain-containing protein n=1 Tax=Xanthovirga aplysinae TaxID=2529853 RepID=UPI0012BC7565|nr:PAAR domain-containing protein [Xanthovirga aplysinae]MTI31894.1 type VI secretion protein [Xanthovirga aplysinae]